MLCPVFSDSLHDGNEHVLFLERIAFWLRSKKNPCQPLCYALFTIFAQPSWLPLVCGLVARTEDVDPRAGRTLQTTWLIESTPFLHSFCTQSETSTKWLALGINSVGRIDSLPELWNPVCKGEWEHGNECAEGASKQLLSPCWLLPCSMWNIKSDHEIEKAIT